MILADENIDHGIIAALRAAGYVVASVYESHRSMSDEAIIQLSRNLPQIILTEDKDFGEWVFAHGIRDISVIFLRYHFRDTAALLATLLELMRTRLPDLTGAFTTVGVHKIRIRPL
ncbi:putative nuclease of putative toxin-antitoxin system [Hymenobacter sp. UYAg731]